MAANKINNMLIPNVSRVGNQTNVDAGRRLDEKAAPNEFSNLLKEQIERGSGQVNNEGINLSVHAAKRLKERNLEIDANEYLKLKNAIETLRNKGGQDSLVITSKAAYIIDVNQNKIVTAIDKDNMAENVFTKIDSTMFVN